MGNKTAAHLTLGMEERKPRARWRPRRRVVSTRRGYVQYRCGRASGQGGRAAAGATRGGVGTADACEAMATTDVGRGGGDVLGVAGRVVWAQGERNRRRTQGRRLHWYIYATPLYSRCHPPTGSKGLPLLPVGNKHRE